MQYSAKEYSQARKILVKNVAGQYVFPEYFLHLNTKDPTFSSLINNSEIEDIPANIIKTRTDNYLSKTKMLELKSKPIASWHDYPKFEFFQFVMANRSLFSVLDNVTFDQLDDLDCRVKNNTITVEQALSEINLDANKVKSFIKSMIDDFKIGDE